MIRLYQGSGSSEIQFVGNCSSDEDWVSLRATVCRLLRARKNDDAAELFESIPFQLYDGTNVFGDEFSLLYYSAPLEEYVNLAEQYEDPRRKQHYRQIANTLTEIGPFIRFIAVELDTKAGPASVPSPTLATTSDAVERALADTEQLIHTRGAVSGVDRIHTAFHGYLRAVATSAGVSAADDASATQLFKLVRDKHPKFGQVGPRANDIDRVLKTMAAIVDALNPLRNLASIAHPNEILLEEAEAMLVINSVRTLLHYLDARLR